MEIALEDGSSVRVDVPANWTTEFPEVQRNPGVFLVAYESESSEEADFHTNLVGTISPVAGLELDTWEEGSEQLLAEKLAWYLPVQRSIVDINGVRWSRRVAAFVTDDGDGVTMTGWSVLSGDIGVTFTMTLANDDYPESQDLLQQVEASLRWSVTA